MASKPRFLGWTLARLRETLHERQSTRKELPTPRVSSTVAAIAVALALSIAGAGVAQAASRAPDAASERWVRANVAANPGSVRVGPNQIRLEPGLTMTLYPRGSARPAQGPVRDCNFKHFCIYEDPGFGKAGLAMSQCRIYNLHKHKFTDKHSRIDTSDNEASSWINNQSGVATLWSGKHGSSTFFKAPVGRDKILPPKWRENVNEVKPC